MDKNKILYSGEELRKRWHDGTLFPSDINEEALRVLLLYENEKIMKGEVYDKEIVDFCNDALLKIQCLFTDKDFEENKKNLFEILHGNRKNISPLSKIKTSRRFFKPVGVTAVCILFLFSIQITSLAMGGNFLESVYSWGTDMIVSLMGKTIHQDDFSAWGREAHVYNDIDEFKKQEDVEVFIPENIQNNILLKIEFLFEDNKRIGIYYENDCTLIINLNEDNTEKYFDMANDILYSYSNIDYHINKENNSISWTFNNDLYRIMYDVNMANYIEIINNLQ